MNFKYILFAALLGVIFIPNSEMVQAAGGSISISSVELVLSNDVDGNGWANDNDVIQVTAIINNTDGSAGVAGTEVNIDVSPYQGIRGTGGVFVTDLPLVEDNNGVGDVYQDTFEIISTDGSESGIEVGVNNAASRVQIIATDDDEVGNTTAFSNPLGDGVVDTRVVNGVDTIYPTDQDTVFATSITRYPDQTFVIVLPEGDTTWHLAPAGLTTTAQIFAQAEVSQGGSDVTTQVPDVLGEYRLYLIDDADQPSDQSSAILTVIERSGGGGAALNARSDADADSVDDSDGVEDNDELKSDDDPCGPGVWARTTDDADTCSDQTASNNMDAIKVDLLMTVLRSDLSLEQKKNLIRMMLLNILQ